MAATRRSYKIGDGRLPVPNWSFVYSRGDVSWRCSEIRACARASDWTLQGGPPGILGNSLLWDDFRLRLIQTPFDVRAQSIAQTFVHARKVEPFWIEVSTAPTDGLGIFAIFPVGDDLQEPFITRHAANTFGRSRPFAREAAPVLWRRSERHELFNRDGVPPAISETIIMESKDGT